MGHCLSLGARAQVDLGRSLRLWLELQGAVNALLDSSTVPESGAQVDAAPLAVGPYSALLHTAHTANGVHYGCIQSNGLSQCTPKVFKPACEIHGVVLTGAMCGRRGQGIRQPPYFATRLSFPERVTAWNVQKSQGLC